MLRPVGRKTNSLEIISCPRDRTLIWKEKSLELMNPGGFAIYRALEKTGAQLIHYMEQN